MKAVVISAAAALALGTGALAAPGRAKQPCTESLLRVAPSASALQARVVHIGVVDLRTVPGLGVLKPPSVPLPSLPQPSYERGRSFKRAGSTCAPQAAPTVVGNPATG